MNKGQFAGLLFKAFTKWLKLDATLRAAALTFFVILPLPTFAYLAVNLITWIYGQQATMQLLITQVKLFAGSAVANLLSQLLTNSQNPLTGGFNSFLAIVFAVSGALGAFSVLQKTVNAIWGFHSLERGRAAFIKEKTLPFAHLVVMGAIVIAWTAIANVLFGMIDSTVESVLGTFTYYLIGGIQIVLSFVLGYFLFALVFKELPEAKVEWGDIKYTAFFTAIIFSIVNVFFGLYLRFSTGLTVELTTVILFLWIYSINLLILYGAQLSKEYTQAFGSHHNKPPVLKWPPRPKVETVEITAEVQIKMQPQKNQSQTEQD
jgi:membrane protein